MLLSYSSSFEDLCNSEESDHDDDNEDEVSVVQPYFFESLASASQDLENDSDDCAG